MQFIHKIWSYLIYFELFIRSPSSIAVNTMSRILSLIDVFSLHQIIQGTSLPWQVLLFYLEMMFQVWIFKEKCLFSILPSTYFWTLWMNFWCDKTHHTTTSEVFEGSLVNWTSFVAYDTSFCFSYLFNNDSLITSFCHLSLKSST